MMKHFVSFKGIADLEEKLGALGLQDSCKEKIQSRQEANGPDKVSQDVSLSVSPLCIFDGVPVVCSGGPHEKPAEVVDGKKDVFGTKTLSCLKPLIC